MKRKDWISLVALLIIVGIALIGEQFHANGEWADGTISLLTKLLPLLVFFIIAVYFRNKKGSYVAWFRRISYVSFAISVVFLFILSMPFMHYFNVVSSQEKIATASRQILDDCDDMFESYKNKISTRKSTYQSRLNTLLNESKFDELADLFPKYTSTIDQNAINTFVTDQNKTWLKNYKANKDTLDNVKRKQYESVLIENFNVFRASSELNDLFQQYANYKKILKTDFLHYTPVEKKANYDVQFDFQGNEDEWRKSKEIFTQMNFNFMWFLSFLVLALFACSSYIFFKDDNVRVPKPRTGAQSIYDKGHNMNNINNDSEID